MISRVVNSMTVRHGQRTTTVTLFLLLQFVFCTELRCILSLRPLVIRLRELYRLMYVYYCKIVLFTSHTYYNFNTQQSTFPQVWNNDAAILLVRYSPRKLITKVFTANTGICSGIFWFCMKPCIM